MRAELIAELATNHGGDVDLACDMVRAAADAGADTVKIQSYTLAKLNPKDPQVDWLKQAHLDEAAHERVMKACQQAKVQFLSSSFDHKALLLLRRLGQARIKIASSAPVPLGVGYVTFLKSWPWGSKGAMSYPHVSAHLTAIPLYPTPLEAVLVAKRLDGWSDHVVGIDACCYMVAKGARVIEKHFSLPGKGRNCPWDADPGQFRALRDWSEQVETMTTGVSQTFRERWRA